MILTTEDGHKIVLNQKTTGKMATGLRRAFPERSPFAASKAAITAVSPVLRRARLVKIHFQTDSGNEYPVFHSPLNGKTVEIIGKHLGRGFHDIVAARTFIPDEELEAEFTEKSVQAKIDWDGPKTLDNAMSDGIKRGIIYIVEDLRRNPIYVGMTTGTFPARWKDRIEALRQLRIDTKNIRVMIGKVDLISGTAKDSASQLKDVEHAVIRSIYNKKFVTPKDKSDALKKGDMLSKAKQTSKSILNGTAILTNISSFLPFRVIAKNLIINHYLKGKLLKPENQKTIPYLQIPTEQRMGNYYELSSVTLPMQSFRI
jgi:hypothetical protein